LPEINSRELGRCQAPSFQLSATDEEFRSPADLQAYLRDLPGALQKRR
jgi:hypothetical protein